MCISAFYMFLNRSASCTVAYLCVRPAVSRSARVQLRAQCSAGFNKKWLHCVQVLLQQPGYLLHKTAKKRGDNDTLIQVPGMKCVSDDPAALSVAVYWPPHGQ